MFQLWTFFSNLRHLKGFRRLVEAWNKCMISFQTYLGKLNIDKLFKDCYQIEDIYSNDFDALVSRASYVQAN